MKKNISFIIPVLAVILCSFLLLTPLDNKIYDLFLRAIPSLTENDSVVIVKIDDPSIENVGVFPWPRDIMADAIVFMREMGAETVAFDLSYLDKSPKAVDIEYLEETLPISMSEGFKQIDEVVTQVMDAFSAGDIAANEADIYKEQILEYNDTVYNEINRSVEKVTFDVDAYFGKTLSYFGKSFLTLTMVSPKDISAQEKTFDMTPHDVPFLENSIALKNITSINDTLTPDQLGILPAIPELITKSRSAGFVNAEPDRDGFRRRVHLLMKYNGKYYGQLSFISLLENWGNPDIEVSNKIIKILNAKVGNSVVDIKIPRTRDGSVLIKWPKKEFKNYNQITSWYLINNKAVEKLFIETLKEMEKFNIFLYWNEDETPIDKYNSALYIKNELFNGDIPEEGITIENYIYYRKEFLRSADLFLNGDYEEELISKLDSDDSIQAVRKTFETARERLSNLIKVRTRAENKMNGAFAIIGFDATSMTDVWQNTFQERFPNVGIYSVVANMLLSREFLDDAPIFISIIISLFLSISLSLVIRQFDLKHSLMAGFITLAVSVVSLLIIFMISRVYVGVVIPFSSVAVTFLSLSSINFLTTIKEKSFIRSAFSRYLSPEVIKDIINDPSKLNLGGEKREMTALFTDIRGFSTISEELDPAELVKLLNMYLTRMSDIILENRGTIDKYEGDAIIAFFGAPIPTEEHASLACKTAIMMKKAENELNKYIISENLSRMPIFTRVGINTGDMVVGNMGTSNKMDYTIIGNSVNLAARLEGVNEQYKTKGILISEHTKVQLSEVFLLRRLDRIRVVGVNTPLRIYELVNLKDYSDSDEVNNIIEWDKALELYEKREFKSSKEILEEVLKFDENDGVVKLFIKRCEEFIHNPPQHDWDGVFNLTKK